jgi:cell wall-associated NlpC family hydrolase
MRRGLGLLVFGVLAAVLGLGSARASGTGTTTGTTTTTSPTTTPSNAPLSVSSLPAGCAGAGAAAVVPPSHPVVALGTPASALGPSGYPSSASWVAFSSSNVSGSGCSSTNLTLASVSLFEGAVTASSVEAKHGKGTVAGLEIDGTAVSATPGQTVPVESWGQLTLGETFGRLTAPLVLLLLQAHDSLAAGTKIAVAFSAAPLPIGRPSSSPSIRPDEKTATKSQLRVSAKKRHRKRQPSKPPPDFPAGPFPFLLGGGLAPAARDNTVVSSAMQYLGVPYLWGGASPKTGFDCSGLVTYVFARLGVSLPHYAAAQWHSPDGVWVAPNRLQPGDLVFFIGSDGTRKAPGHVGIYAGDGYIIDAPHTGSVVRIDSLSEPRLANGYVGARRIVGRLVGSRHLPGVTNPEESDTAIPRGLPSLIALAPLGEPLGFAAAGTAMARAPSRGYWIWAGGVLGGLLLVLPAGRAFVLRRRRHTPEPLN